MVFLRQQLSPYCIPVWKRFTYRGTCAIEVEMLVPAMKAPTPVPHGRNVHTGEPGDWGPDKYGYTDFDDYHLAVYGA
jgi:hypothetical protein